MARGSDGAGARSEGARSSTLVLGKITQILTSFSVEDPEPTLVELTRRTGLPASTCQRLVQDLVREGFLDRVGDRYRIGIRMVRWATPGTLGLDVVQLVKPVLADLRDATGETACFYVRDGAFRTVVAVAETRHVVMRPFRVGQVMPLHAGAPGKVFLAFDPQARDAVVDKSLEAFTAMTPVTLSQLDEQAKVARHQGWYAALGERHIDVGSVAAPVLDHGGDLAGVLGLGFPLQRVAAAAAESLGPGLRAAALRASELLGFSDAARGGLPPTTTPGR